MGPSTSELCTDLEQLVTLLQGCGEQHWSSWLARDRTAIQGSDFSGVEHFLSAFGGMGSINDLVLHPSNGHRVRPSETDEINARLRRLLARSYELASRIRRTAVFE